MEQRRQDEHHGSFANAFVLGLVVGVAITLLLTTKKGRKILKTLTDEGMNKLGKWEEVLQQKPDPVAKNSEDDIDEMTEAQDYVTKDEVEQVVTPNHVSDHAVKHSMKVEEHHNGVEKAPSSSPRRFFRGAKKS